MGVLHGVAGTSHFLGVLPALAMPTRAAALVYIAAFGGGSILAMRALAPRSEPRPVRATQRAFMLSRRRVRSSSAAPLTL